MFVFVDVLRGRRRRIDRSIAKQTSKMGSPSHRVQVFHLETSEPNIYQWKEIVSGSLNVEQPVCTIGVIAEMDL